ncbi:hypothetical protein PGT21_022816 [Puccinia graminis f. sp. tritici]|uniref:Uncharacterized protein n=1 Tax=Puccinia graminis f. sp. tritici TaxID=56615 RepID=A0A5B0QUS6_PUCGR|nr:hypothetical protein PGT21_022816 [Puccinia graminis f. sp. tritici]
MILIRPLVLLHKSQEEIEINSTPSVSVDSSFHDIPDVSSWVTQPTLPPSLRRDHLGPGDYFRAPSLNKLEQQY